MQELNNALPKAPFFFLKPTTSYIGPGEAVLAAGTLHHEVELAVVIGRTASRLTCTDAELMRKYIGGYALALDMTDRAAQEAEKTARVPWTTAKCADTWLPICELIPRALVRDPHNLQLKLWVDGVLRQDGCTGDMIFKIPQLVRAASHLMTLERGDVLLTGTPAGVADVSPGQAIDAQLVDNASASVLSRGHWPVRLLPSTAGSP